MSLPDRYLSLLKKSLLDELYLENETRLFLLTNLLFGLIRYPDIESIVRDFVAVGRTPLHTGLLECRRTGAWVMMGDGSREFDLGRNFTFTAHSMIGRARMDNLHKCMDRIVADSVPGDFIETGVWKGGATIFMRGFLKAHDIRDRKVWVADSFEGLPKASAAQDAGWDFTKYPYLSVGLEEVQELFARYELLDKQVRFLKGWFKDTLPAAPIKKLALLRLDGDLYESTMDALTNLYDKLSPGGYCIIDDYHGVAPCKVAVDEFRTSRAIRDRMIDIDHDSVYWRKPA